MKQKARFILLLALAAVLVGLQFRQPSSPAAVAPAAEPRGAARAATTSASLAIPDSVLEVAQRKPDARLRAGALQRNIFEYGRRAPAPVAQPVVDATPVAPPPPPAPVRFYGFVESGQGGQRQAFLTDGEEIYVAAEGDVVLRRYRVLRVRKESVELEEVAGGRHRWIVPLEQP